MLAAASQSKTNIDCLKSLLAKDANYKAKDSYDNSLLHIAAIYNNNNIIKYIVKSVKKLDIFARNQDGETALNICSSQKNDAGVKILEDLMVDYDDSKA